MGNGRYIRVRWNIAPETISLVILGIIWVYSRKGSHLPSLKNRMFQECLTVTFAAMLSNILSTFMLSGYILVPVWVTWAITTIYFILTPLMGMVYYLYAVSVIYEERPQLNRMILLGGIPGAVYTLLVLSNFFTKCLFDITANQGYEQGSLIFITYLIFYAYCACCIVIAVRNRRSIDRHIYHILATFPVLAVLVIFFQQMYPNIILSGSAATCALLIIYLHLQNRQISLDYLTNVPNRQELLNMLDLLLRRYPDKDFTLLVVSIRDFRQINNICGQHRGDAFLKQVCAFLCSVGPKENVYRYSGDEFALFLYKCSSRNQLMEYEAGLRKTMETCTAELDNGERIQVRFSDGYAFYPEDGTDTACLLKHADESMYEAKRAYKAASVGKKDESRGSKEGNVS